VVVLAAVASIIFGRKRCSSERRDRWPQQDLRNHQRPSDELGMRRASFSKRRMVVRLAGINFNAMAVVVGVD
jgi:hypothetical protein